MSGIVGGVGAKSGVIGTTELDYEEGTWTATLTNGTLHSSHSVLTYIKIKNQVTCCGMVKVNSGSASQMVINNMPFTSRASITNNSNVSAGSVRLYDVDVTAGLEGVYCRMSDNSILLAFEQQVDSSAGASIAATVNGFYGFTITYFIN